MNPSLKRSIWKFQYNLSKAQSLMINVGMRDTEKRIRSSVEALRYFALLLDLPSITTFTGAQGVGKSYHVNQLLEVPMNQRLLSTLGRAEKIPVFLLKRTSTLNYDVRLFKRTIPSDTGSFLFQDMCYDDARQRVSQPENDDLCMFWNVDGNAVLDSLAPIAVLPGFEYETPWELAIRIILDLSDSVVYVTDQSRSAMQVSDSIEQKIKELKLTTPAVVLLAKVDDMTEERIKEFAGNFPYQSVPVGLVSSSKEAPPKSQSTICTQAQYDELIKHLGDHVANLSPLHRLQVLEDSVDKAMIYLSDAREEIDKIESSHSVAISKAVDMFISEQNEAWNRLIRINVVNYAKSQCAIAAKEAHDAVQPMINTKFTSMGGKVSVWWNDGVTLKFLNEMQTVLSSAFTKRTIKMSVEVGQKLETASNDLARTIQTKDDCSFEELVRMGKQLILLDSVSARLERIDEKINSDLGLIVKGASSALERAGELTDDAIGLYNKVLSTITDLGVHKGKEAIHSELMKLKDGRKSHDMKNLLIQAGTGATGTSWTAAELAGAGFTGTTMSVVAGVLGGVIAGIAVGSWLMSVTRTANKTAFMVDDLAIRYAQAMSDQLQADLSEKLDRFWEFYCFRMKTALLADTGLAQTDRSTILLAQTTHSAMQEGRSIIKVLSDADAC